MKERKEKERKKRQKEREREIEGCMKLYKDVLDNDIDV